MTFFSSIKHYEFSAFSLGELQSGGLSGDVNCGDKFTMPSTAGVCLSVKDDDRFLSGDNRHNENADDWSYQTASIVSGGHEIGNGRQVYAESYFWVCDQNGKWYVMIEIEQEGSGAKFYSFHEGYGIPADGAKLTVGAQYDVCGDWIDMNCLSAGDKTPEKGEISGRLTFDADCNDNEWNEETCSWDAGIDGQTVKLLDAHGNVVATTTTDHYGNYKFVVAAGDYRVEFPKLDGYEFSEKDSGVDDHYDSDADASGLTDVIHLQAGKTIHNVDAGLKQCDDCPEGALKLDFEGLAKGTVVTNQFEGVTISANVTESLKYAIEAEHMSKHGFVTAFGCNASGSKLVRLCGDSGKLAADFHGKTGVYDVKIRVQDECDGQSVLKLVVDGHVVKTIKLDGDNNGGGSDNGHFSTITIEDVAIAYGQKVELVAYRNGHEYVRVDKITFETSVTENRAMIFDTDHITGGDYDLKNGDGKVLIISEDGDSHDPDDNAAGGAVHFDFDVPTGVYSIDVIDAEEGGKIELFDINGAKIGEVTIPHVADGKVQTVKLGFEGVSKMVVKLNGSGALDNLCYKPEDQDPMTAAIGDKVFFDADKDGQQDDGELGVEGVMVELLDADGNVLADTLTDAEGEYLFEGLAAGDYKVRFTTKDGLVFTDVNQGPDATDSDADQTTGETGVYTLAEGETNLTVDAGLVDPGTASLGDLVFFDANENGVFDAGDGVVEGVTVELLQGDDVVATDTTDAAGLYLFEGLDAGDYRVRFTAPTGLAFTAASVAAADAVNNDSDANIFTGETGVIALSIGEAERDVDAGLIQPNRTPTPMNDTAKLCSDTAKTIDVVLNDTDPDGDALTIVSVGGQAIAEDETVTLASGAEVTLKDGKLVYSLEGADSFDDLLIGQQAADSFVYAVADADGATAEATVDVTVCGAKNTLETIEASLPTDGEFVVTLNGSASFFTVSLSGTGDDRFDKTFDAAYCISADTPIRFNISYTATLEILDKDIDSAVVSLPENVGYINWILNQDFTSMGNGEGGFYTEGEIQGAIWGLTDGLSFLDDVPNTFGTDANALEIYNMALAAGDAARDFVPGEGDIIGIALIPTDPGVQPFVIGIPFEDLALPCDCALI